MKKEQSPTGIHIGANVDQATVASITAAILEILATAAGDGVKSKALETLSHAFKVENINISDCIFENKE